MWIDQGVVTSGHRTAAAGGRNFIQAADVLYYASGGYYVALTFTSYGLLQWKESFDACLARDMISAASLGRCMG